MQWRTLIAGSAETSLPMPRAMAMVVALSKTIRTAERSASQPPSKIAQPRKVGTKPEQRPAV
jgi:hypothetical protein